MNMYSQNNEETHIWDFFKDKKFPKRFLDIGANDGVTLSNTYRLYKRGWRGTYVEPDKRAYYRLIDNVDARNECYNIAIGDRNETVTFYQGGDNHIPDSLGILSTTKRTELKRWGSTESFHPVQCEMRTVAKSGILDHAPYSFVNIDAEGVDFEILKQLDLTKLGVQMLCIEYNNNTEMKENIVYYCAHHNMYLKHKNYENLIFVR